MNNFEQYLFPDEKILWQGRPVQGKGDKSVGGEIFVIIFVLLMQILLIWSVVYKVGDGADGVTLNFIIIFLATLVFDVICIQSILYKKIFKKYAVADDYYCLTNKRAIKYESKKDEICFGYLINYSHISSEFVKDGYGDLYMSVEYDESIADESNLKDIVINNDKENMKNMHFESIKNPNEVKKIAKKAREELISAGDALTIDNIKL